ncbi:MAG: transglutaminase domain-containing protein [Planctomycetes bacterium]|nr:transglutaminase domain-containing protein [Planctomycetota bacterium]
MRRLLPLALTLLAVSCSSNPPAPIEESLLLADKNRTELEMVLGHYRRLRDPQKLEAARFLVANMSEHGFVRYDLTDSDGNALGFDARRFANLDAAQRELDRLEALHPGADFQRTRFDRDVETITAEFLIENIELAFEAWRTKPWAQQVSFEVFQQFVLPYRGSNEPLSRWRPECLAQWADLARRLDDPTDLQRAGQLVREGVDEWIRFSDLYYLHPTDQSFAEMRRSRVGRCEDISNLASFALRANAIPVATDFTPWWADRDNNHAWEVRLDGEGNGRAALSNRAAKVYRKTFAIQRDGFAARLPQGTTAPRWLDRKDYVDVTSQYVATADVELVLADRGNDAAAYLCVFNGGEWRAISGALVADDGAVRFADMGRDVCYLPAWFRDGVLVPAAPPFVLPKDGPPRPLVAGNGRETVVLSAAAPSIPDADTGRAKPALSIEPGAVYELYSWEGGWKSHGELQLAEGKALDLLVPEGALLWLVRADSRRLERIFTVREGFPRWW